MRKNWTKVPSGGIFPIWKAEFFTEAEEFPSPAEHHSTHYLRNKYNNSTDTQSTPKPPLPAQPPAISDYFYTTNKLTATFKALALTLATSILSYAGVGLADSAAKFLGNTTTLGEIPEDYETYWNQITPENKSMDRLDWRG